MPPKPSQPFELKLGYLLPAFFVLGAAVNLAITNPPALALEGYADVAIRPSILADYAPDQPEMIFPPMDADIMDDANNDASSDGEAPLEPPVDPLATNTPTSLIAIPTLPPVLQPVADLLPTELPLVPTLAPIINTLVPPVVKTLIPPIIEDLIPTEICIPLPLLPCN